MKALGSFSFLVLGILLSWVLVIFLTVTILRYVPLAGVAIALAMLVIVWMVTATEKAR